ATPTTPGPSGTPTAQVFPGGKALITWSAPVSNGGSPINFYYVTAHLVGGKGKTVKVGATTTMITGLSTGRYYFTVVAVNALGGGAPSAPSLFYQVSSSPGVTKVYVTPPGHQAPGTITIRVSTNQPGAVVHLFDEYAGAHTYVQKAISTAVPNKSHTAGVVTFHITGVRKTNHFFAVVNNVKSNVVTAFVR
ncbi:MAG: fibronectin type III domain-containing protein, partial [Acidimicrobiales bacterium]